MNMEQAVMSCPQCEGEGTYADGLDEMAITVQCTRCAGNGWIVNLDRLILGGVPRGLMSEIVSLAQRDEGTIADAARRVASWSGDRVNLYKAAKRELATVSILVAAHPPTLDRASLLHAIEVNWNAGPDALVEAIVTSLTSRPTDQPATGEHWAIEQVKGAVTCAMVDHGAGLGMSVSSRLAADVILRLLVPHETHRPYQGDISPRSMFAKRRFG